MALSCSDSVPLRGSGRDGVEIDGDGAPADAGLRARADARAAAASRPRPRVREVTLLVLRQYVRDPPRCSGRLTRVPRDGGTDDWWTPATAGLLLVALGGLPPLPPGSIFVVRVNLIERARGCDSRARSAAPARGGRDARSDGKSSKSQRNALEGNLDDDLRAWSDSVVGGVTVDRVGPGWVRPASPGPNIVRES